MRLYFWRGVVEVKREGEARDSEQAEPWAINRACGALPQMALITNSTSFLQGACIGGNCLFLLLETYD